MSSPTELGELAGALRSLLEWERELGDGWVEAPSAPAAAKVAPGAWEVEGRDGPVAEEAWRHRDSARPRPNEAAMGPERRGSRAGLAGAGGRFSGADARAPGRAPDDAAAGGGDDAAEDHSAGIAAVFERLGARSPGSEVRGLRAPGSAPAPSSTSPAPVSHAPADRDRPAGAPTVRASTAAASSGASMEVTGELHARWSADPAADPASRERRLTILAREAAACTRCELHVGRTHSVFARGSAVAEIAFVGEGPGYNEDQQGLPFVGAAGQLLDRMVRAMGLGRDDVYICNVVKCRPPENRTPLPPEAAACAPFLEEQLAIVAPKVLVALGRCAVENLGCMPDGGRGWRGTWREWRGIPVMPTYHPAFLLRSPEYKKPVWEDLQKVLARLGRPLPSARER